MKKNYIEPVMVVYAVSPSMIFAESIAKTSDQADPNYVNGGDAKDYGLPFAFIDEE